MPFEPDLDDGSLRAARALAQRHQGLVARLIVQGFRAALARPLAATPLDQTEAVSKRSSAAASASPRPVAPRRP